MCKFAYDFSTGIPLNIFIIYGKDPNFILHFINAAPKFKHCLIISESDISQLFCLFM